MDFTECWSDTCSEVAVAVKVGNIDYLHQLIQQKKPVDVSDNRGWKPLHEAAALSPSILCLEELLKHEKTNINWVTHEGETALLLACRRRNISDVSPVVSLLLQHGADPNIKDNEEETPLLAAVRNGFNEVVDLLIAAGANINAPDCGRWTALHEAASKNDTPTLLNLLQKGAHIDEKDECGLTPVFTAAQYGAENCLKELLTTAEQRGQQSVVDLGAEDWATPLMIAAQQGFENCVKLLLEHGANPDLRTSDQVTALHLAVQGNHKDCLDILLERMSLQPLISTFHPSTYQDTLMVCPLHLAVDYSSHECMKSLLQAGFSPDSLYDCSLPLATNIPGLPEKETALSYAVYKRNDVAIGMLLTAGASCNPPVPQAIHPLLRALNNPTTMEFHILIESGCDVNFQRQPTPTNDVLLYCLLTNSICLRPLLYYGCDPNLCLQEGHEVFVRCCYRFLRKEVKATTLPDFLHFFLKFLIYTKSVQAAVRALSQRIAGDIMDIWEEINQPTPLKQLCFVKIRQHLYRIHGVKFPEVVSQLHLPPFLEEYIACRDLKFPSIDEPLIISTPENDED